MTSKRRSVPVDFDVDFSAAPRPRRRMLTAREGHAFQPSDAALDLPAWAGAPLEVPDTLAVTIRGASTKAIAAHDVADPTSRLVSGSTAE